MAKKKIGINIDHVATIRNARGEIYPDPLRAALEAQKYGADSITIHLREDRRHIRDYDLINIKKNLKIPLNLEIAPTSEMLNIALRHKPKFVCIVPEKRSEITTEGGLNLKKNKSFLRKAIKKLKKKNIRVSLFIEPKISDIAESKDLGVNCIELHTGKYCSLFNNNKSTSSAFRSLKIAAAFAHKNSLIVHAGHGLTYKSAFYISKIKEITEFNIGHFIISDAIFISLEKSIKKMKKIINR
jgi:pyridoxine 5-phosphate synthase